MSSQPPNDRLREEFLRRYPEERHRQTQNPNYGQNRDTGRSRAPPSDRLNEEFHRRYPEEWRQRYGTEQGHLHRTGESWSQGPPANDRLREEMLRRYPETRQSTTQSAGPRWHHSAGGARHTTAGSRVQPPNDRLREELRRRYPEERAQNVEHGRRGRAGESHSHAQRPNDRLREEFYGRFPEERQRASNADHHRRNLADAFFAEALGNRARRESETRQRSTQDTPPRAYYYQRAEPEETRRDQRKQERWQHHDERTRQAGEGQGYYRTSTHRQSSTASPSPFPPPRPSTPPSENETQRFQHLSDAPCGYYTILGVERTVRSADVRRAYLQLSRQHHPDRVVDEAAKADAETRFKILHEAYECLSNDVERQSYDLRGGRKRR